MVKRHRDKLDLKEHYVFSYLLLKDEPLKVKDIFKGLKENGVHVTQKGIRKICEKYRKKEYIGKTPQEFPNDNIKFKYKEYKWKNTLIDNRYFLRRELMAIHFIAYNYFDPLLESWRKKLEKERVNERLHRNYKNIFFESPYVQHMIDKKIFPEFLEKIKIRKKTIISKQDEMIIRKFLNSSPKALLYAINNIKTNQKIIGRVLKGFFYRMVFDDYQNNNLYQSITKPMPLIITTSMGLKINKDTIVDIWGWKDIRPL